MAAAGVAAAGVLAAGPDGDVWAGGALMLGGIAAGGILAGVAIVRGPLRRFQSGVVLAVLLLGMGGYYAVRLVLYLVAGPYSDVFGTYVGTELTTVVLALVINGSALTMVALRSAGTTRNVLLTRNFDAATGARTPTSFEPRAAQVLREAEERARQVCLVLIQPDDVESIRLAFGRSYADEALVLCGETASMLLPPRALLGLDAEHGARFEVLLRDATPHEAVEWAAGLRAELLDTALQVPSTRVRITVSVGVASAPDVGYDLARLRAAADGAARTASEHGGNETVVASGAPAPS